MALVPIIADWLILEQRLAKPYPLLEFSYNFDLERLLF
jgi:hypothetical protein